MTKENMKYEAGVIHDKAYAIVRLINALKKCPQYRELWAGVDTDEKIIMCGLLVGLETIASDLYEYAEDLKVRIGNSD